MRIPPRLLRRIIADLARVGLVNTFPGPKGGLELASPARTIRLRHIWEAIEGPLLISDCVEGMQACPLEAGCPVNRHWLQLQVQIVRDLDSITLEELAAEAAEPPEGFSMRADSRFSAPLEV
jgi:Rrf2 family protein